MQRGCWPADPKTQSRKIDCGRHRRFWSEQAPCCRAISTVWQRLTIEGLAEVDNLISLGSIKVSTEDLHYGTKDGEGPLSCGRSCFPENDFYSAIRDLETGHGGWGQQIGNQAKIGGFIGKSLLFLTTGPHPLRRVDFPEQQLSWAG